MTFEEAAREFLNQKRIAVVGVSRAGDATGNAIYRMLRDRGYTAIPVHPDADTVEGVPCYPNLMAIPGGVDAVMVVTRPSVSDHILQDAVQAGVPRVWMHYNPLFGEKNSSVSHSAVVYGREHGLTVIDGGCPLMFLEFSHKCMRWVLDRMGKLPKTV